MVSCSLSIECKQLHKEGQLPVEKLNMKVETPYKTFYPSDRSVAYLRHIYGWRSWGNKYTEQEFFSKIVYYKIRLKFAPGNFCYKIINLQIHLNLLTILKLRITNLQLKWIGFLTANIFNKTESR